MGITERFLVCLITVVFNKGVHKLGTKVSKYKKAFYPCTYYGVVFNPSSTNLLLFPSKTSENLWFSDIFRGYRSGTLVENGIMPQTSFGHEPKCLKWKTVASWQYIKNIQRKQFSVYAFQPVLYLYFHSSSFIYTFNVFWCRQGDIEMEH